MSIDTGPYLHETPYLGRLIDPAIALPHQERKPEKPTRVTEDIGRSPAAARAKGAKISGRIFVVTTNFSVVGVRDPSKGIRLRTRRGLSSLTSAIEYLTTETDWECIPVAWPGELESTYDEEDVDQFHQELSDEEKERFTKQLIKANGGDLVLPVWLNGPALQWREYSEHVLWSTFHYVQTSDNEALEQATFGWNNYVELNRRFAEEILKEYKDGDIVWIHDYYLLLLPQLIRQKHPDAKIGLYIHSPFPSSEFIRCLPQRKELLEGMLGSTMVGFQSQTYVRHFISATTRLTGIEHVENKLLSDGRFVACCALPIGIDIQTVVNSCQTPRVQALAKEIREIHAGKHIIVGRDKLDLSHGVPQKLRAFELFLQLYPEWHDKVVLIQITTRNWSHLPKLEALLSQEVSYINGEFGSIHFAPIQHYTTHIDQDEYFALLGEADLGFFIPVREGTSHAALEYIACQHNRPCSMVLSEFMGISEVLEGSVNVNPYDALQVAHAINRALTTKGTRMYEKAAGYNVQDYAKSFLSLLLQHDVRNESQHSTPEIDVKKLTSDYSKAKKRLFLLDYDGTLTPIVQNPAAAVPSPRLNKILDKLCADPRNDIWVISGRDSTFLDKWLGRFPLSMSSEHGCFVKHPGDKQWTDLVAKEDLSWMPIVLEVLQWYTERTEASSIERKEAAITWHYRRSDPVFGAFQASHLRSYLELTISHRYPVDVINGKANVEIRPKLFNKGEIVRTVFKQCKEHNDEPDFVLCLGDDTTDEDMFRAVNDQHKDHGFHSVMVGPESKLTLARAHVPNVNGVHDMLASLADADTKSS